MQEKDFSENKSQTNKKKWFIILHILILFLSFCGVFAKLASAEDLFSLKFIIFYACELVILVIYTFFWQQVLKYIPLTVAFCNKAVGMIWTMLWGVVLFKESFIKKSQIYMPQLLITIKIQKQQNYFLKQYKIKCTMQ